MAARLHQISVSVWLLLAFLAVATHAFTWLWAVWGCGLLLAGAWAAAAVSSALAPPPAIAALPARAIALAALPLVVAALAFAQFLLGWSPTPWATRQQAFCWTLIGGASLLSLWLFAHPSDRRRAIRILILGGVLITLLALLQSLISPDRIWFHWETRVPAVSYSPFVNHSKFANFLEILLAPAIVLAVQQFHLGGLSRAGIWILSATILWAAAPASESRGGFLLLSMEAVLVLWLLRRRQPNWFGQVRWGAFILTSALTLLVSSWALGAGALIERVRYLNLFEDGRPAILATAWDVAAHAPAWFGFGIGSWQQVYLAHARFDAGLLVNQAHCDWLQWYVEGGMLLTATFATMLYISIRAALRDPTFTGLPILFVHALFDFPFQQTPNLILFLFLWFGLACASLEERPAIEPSRCETP